jgi:exodeoxyribonuclease V alpha subunit
LHSLDHIRDIQVLCPMNRGGVGARSLNIELQAALNPAGDNKVERFGWTFAPGDKVMQIENDYDKEVYNGDIGYIDDVDTDAGEIVATFDGRSAASARRSFPRSGTRWFAVSGIGSSD